MKKKHGFIIGLLICLAIILLIYAVNWFGESNSNPLDYARITDVDYTAVVVDEPGSSSKVVITERLTFDIHAASKNNLYWELWRALPEEYIDWVRVYYKVNYVKQLFDDGKESVVFTKAPKLYWDDDDYINTANGLGPGKWYHSEGPYNKNLAQYECVLFYVDGLYREKVVFEIEYEMRNAVFRYGDSSELYISLYSGNEIKFLKSFKGQILFPNEKMPGAGNYYANTYGTNSHTFPFVESTTINPGYHTFSFELNESELKFRPYNQYIEFALVSYGEDSLIFSQNAGWHRHYSTSMLDELRYEQAKYEALPKNYKIIKITILLLFSAGTFLTAILVLGVDKKMKKTHVFYQPSMQIDYFRDIPSELDPNLAASLVFCRHKQKESIQDGYAAVVLSLVYKGYIELDKINNTLDWSSGNVRIIVKYHPIQPPPILNSDGQLHDDMQNQWYFFENAKPLTQTEEQYLNLILRHSNGTEISLSSFQKKVSADYENTNSFIRNVNDAVTNMGISQGYFQKAEYTKLIKQVKKHALALAIIGGLLVTAGNLILYQTRLDLAFGSFFLLGLGFIAGAIILNVLSNGYVLLTQFGEDEYVKWRGLYNFLCSETLMQERTVIELPQWENYLIYATAFGISKKVIKALEIRCPNADESPVLRRNAYYRTRIFYVSHRSFRTAVRTARYTAQRSGRYGGYGGGGRGGGGGGGGH